MDIREGFLEEVSPKLSSAENEARTWSLSAAAPSKTLTSLRPDLFKYRYKYRYRPQLFKHSLSKSPEAAGRSWVQGTLVLVTRSGINLAKEDSGL